MSVRWFRDAYAAAVWESDLTATQKLVALAYADHAGDSEFSWIPYTRLQQRAHLSRDAIHRAQKELVRREWLEVKEPARQHYSTRYWLRIPPQPSVSQTPEQYGTRTSEASSTTDVPLRGASRPSDDTSRPSDDTSRPSDVPDHHPHHSTQLSDERDAAPETARAVIELLARYGPGLTENSAARAVAAVMAKKNPADPAAYMSRFTREDVDRWAGASGGDTTRPSDGTTQAAVPCAVCSAPDERTCRERNRRVAADEGHEYEAKAKPGAMPAPARAADREERAS